MNATEMNATEVSKMSVADIEAALEMLKENNLENWSYAALADEIQREGSIVLIAIKNFRRVGFCVARLIMQANSHSTISTISTINGFKTDDIKGQDCEIYNIAVKREFQNCGVGQSLLDGLIFLARDSGAESFWLEVRSSNVRAIEFYRKNGFRKIYERKNFYANPIESAFVMRKNHNRTLLDK